ncbi:hypothetical protein [Psychroflexus montanilacus]|uniref:hypothetical protein n=1 Tax=Psychroflexus montanilacus TaxID=2873598 RepID=UPI001CCEA640|nr:hypothetical protein [Psychroflexus montanilacus]MBZ9650883.1 hypothetical protein [Psychroflexus montanilacus]
MKKYKVYKNIRKKAVIFGLPLSLFALMMISIIASLLIIIFSFSLGILSGVLLMNTTLYVVLTKIAHKPQLLHLGKAFPKTISNKRNSNLSYE